MLYGGPGAVQSGAAAARLHGLERVPALPDRAALVLVDHARRCVSRPPVTVERTRRPPSPCTIRGLPVAPLPRAVVDTARHLADLDAVRALLAEPVQRGMTTPRALRRELEEGSGRGTARVRTALLEIEGGARSVPEVWARAVTRTPDARRPLPEHREGPSWVSCDYSRK